MYQKHLAGGSGTTVTKAEVLQAVIARFDGLLDKHYRPLGQFELIQPQHQGNYPTEGTPFAEFEKVFDEMNLPAAGSGTMGRVMRETGLTSHELHQLACICEYPSGVIAVQVAQNLRKIRDAKAA